MKNWARSLSHKRKQKTSWGFVYDSFLQSIEQKQQHNSSSTSRLIGPYYSQPQYCQTEEFTTLYRLSNRILLLHVSQVLLHVIIFIHAHLLKCTPPVNEGTHSNISPPFHTYIIGVLYPLISLHILTPASILTFFFRNKRNRASWLEFLIIAVQVGFHSSCCTCLVKMASLYVICHEET